jgi:ElaB/YqjD/DUF883 family membrane-anchored ribosome-binding protein
MADEIRVTEVTDREGVARTGAAATMPGDPGAAREEIQATRARISETIDEIEGALLQKKERIEDRLDVMAPVREQPMRTLGIVFGAGLLLGFLTGGDDEEEDEDDDEEHEEHERVSASADERAELWEHRARRLLRIAREQEDEIESLRRRRARKLRSRWANVRDGAGERWEGARDEASDRWHEVKEGASDRWDHLKDEASDVADEGLSVVDRVREYVSEHIAGVLADSVGHRVRNLDGR